jgi:DNA sulfur modification protein DndC
VEKDKSMEGFIDAGFEHLEPLMEFRDWLVAMRADRSRRMAERRNGLATFMPDGTLIPGPYTLAAREEMLTRLLRVQAEVEVPLISQSEIEKIKSIWAQDTVDRARRLLKTATQDAEVPSGGEL